MRRPRSVPTLLLAAMLTSAILLTTGSPATAGGGAQVTRKEYRAVQIDMKWRKVRNIVGSRGVTDHASGDCYVKRFTGWNDQTVYFLFDDSDGDGIVRLEDKARLGPLGGIPPICPGVS